MPGCMDSHLRGRDGSLQGPRDEVRLSVAMEDGSREKGQRAEMAEARQLLTQVYERETSILGIQLQELAQTSAGWEEGSTLVMLNWEERPVYPSVTDGKPSKQKWEDHRKQGKRTAAWPALAGCTTPSLHGGRGALASLFKNRDSSSGYKGPCGWDHYRVSWPQEDSMIGPLKEERDTKQVNPEDRNQ